MLERSVEKLLLQRLAEYPAAALVGPRQCGKTTLAKSLGGRYFDLEQDADRLQLDLAWDELVRGSELVILDEAHSWPEVFQRLRGAIDQERKRMGRFLLLGSVSPTLMTHVSESLAGRLALVELTPLLAAELDTEASRVRRWLCGGYPDGGVLRPRAFPQWQVDYLALLTQRDLPAWGLPAKPRTTERLMRMLAAVHGQIWNASEIAKSLGISYHAVNSYVDYFVGAFLVRRLPPYQANIRKRLVKRPKIYWRDTGLLHAILNTPDKNVLLGQPWVGSSWEGHVIEQALGELASADVRFDAYYLRTSDGYELDLLLDMGQELWAIEVKLTSSPGPHALRRLDAVADLIGATRRYVVCQVAEPSGDGLRLVCDLPTFLADLHRR